MNRVVRGCRENRWIAYGDHRTQQLRASVDIYNKLQPRIKRPTHEKTNSHCVVPFTSIAGTTTSSRWLSSCLTPTRHRVGSGSCLHIDGIIIDTISQASFEGCLNAVLERLLICRSPISDLYAQNKTRTRHTSSTLRAPVKSIASPEKERLEVGRGIASEVTDGVNSPGETLDWGLGVGARTS